MCDREPSSASNLAPPAARRRFGVGWLGAGGTVLVLPKCFGCVLGYAALFGGPELCGAAGPDHRWAIAGVLMVVALLAVAAVYDRRRGRNGRRS